jgi:hypothetical protein
MPITLPLVERAKFTPFIGEKRGQPIPVQFNPSSLQFTVANSLDPKKKNKAGVQFVSQSTAKLTMDLIFDTTDTGLDVRISTDQISNLYFPYKKKNKDKDNGSGYPPLVEFGWGSYTFQGIVEQYKETLDFFSANGVPLRSSINLTLSKSAPVFESTTNRQATVDSDLTPEPVEVPGSSAAAGGASSFSLAITLGDPRAARSIASLSGSESLRFGGGQAALVVTGSASLSPPVAFSAGAGLGMTATAGEAFAGLRVGASATDSRGVTDSQALLPSPGGASGGGFALGGAAQAGAGGSLSADVGASADLSARIGFPD